MAGRTGGELIQNFLETYEIPFVFGNPGTTETTFLAAIAASKATYVLSLHESSAVGIAAGYALITGKPSVVSLHTYPGLANGMFNMRNALMAGVPLLVVNGQQDSHFLIHNPVLGAPNTQLAETATKYSYEVTSIDDLAVALQRCYLQARLQPTGPVFLSIPMNFMLERTGHARFKKTQIIEDAVPRAVGDVARALKAIPAKKLAIVADYAVGAAHGLDALSRIAAALDADIYAAPFHVQGTVDPLHPNFRGQLPPTTKEINETLSRYHTMLLVGEKVDTFTYDGRSALPSELQLIQIAPATSQLGFDYPCDIAVLGEIKATLDAIATALGAQGRNGQRANFRSGGSRSEISMVWQAPKRCTHIGRVATPRSGDARHYRGVFRRRDCAGHGGSPWLSERSFFAARRRFGLGHAPRCRDRSCDGETRYLLRWRRRQSLFDPCALDGGQICHSIHIHLLCESRISVA
jgi:benzoylformate decarboxylase